MPIPAQAHTRLRPQSYGFTLIELLVVIAIVAILAGIAAPSFNPLIERWRVLGSVSAFESSIYLARSEAIKRGGSVVMRKLPKNRQCTLASTNQEWGCGWEVFVDSNRNNRRDTSDLLLQTIAPQNATNVMLPGNRGGQLTFDRWGQINGLSAGRIVISPEPAGASSPATKALCISSGGRIRIVDGEVC
ncbi:prepilin-type N-terminal cleavage/methylation domain-containing protein [Allofranklinella schreckenbergeri]|uniref:Type II secretion system protein H n=1 Tax=Allofranklinella schreckenbergeri TaxID=1076744 RepID=A0A3M6QSS3_9BURK|nr:GspH/FimT family pseudopilin [Allofranklinella schreckenbergeri]RMX06085.1 prepilin-type N-terminal cleavage/methylation domain-containing protein [Allofranklinella schreckenbergeri]